ncbi:hypothetical protein LTR84_002117 [Exophiala bonariae]|uniref:Transcription factor domain-containing protein n=1 Tax=Exophiala bonariae TaxID=1690606 RepID=A0AAV9NAG4_9EURO|nr:hypothetical protein LTR84_002117 [Exophiala bonariae]
MTAKCSNITIRFALPDGIKVSVRERELEDAARRSHAARAAHARRRQAREREAPSFQEPTQSNESTQVECAPENHTPQDVLVKSLISTTRELDQATTQVPVATYQLSLLEGNSDPFGSFSIKITPQINRVLAFMRDAIYPSIYYHNKFMSKINEGNPDRSNWISAGIGVQAWEFAIEGLHSEGASLACIASYLGNMAMLLPERARPNANRLALALATKSCSLLQKSLPTDGTSVNPAKARVLIAQIYFLYRASVVGEDRMSVAIYGPILKRFLVEGISQGLVDVVMLYQAAVDDIDFVSKFMCRPLFDYSWFGEISSGFWALAEPLLPLVGAEISTGVHRNVECKELRDYFTTARHMNTYAEHMIPESAWGPTAQKRLAYSWFATKSLWALGSALNLYLDLRDDRYTKSTSTATSGQRLTQAALTLGLVYYFRNMGHTTTIGSVDIRDCSASLMHELRATIAQALKMSTEKELHTYADAHLWVLFLGAFYERREWQRLGDAAGRWFRQKLVEKALQSNKATWAYLQPVLGRFFYMEWENPHGSTWFDDTVIEIMGDQYRHLQSKLMPADFLHSSKTVGHGNPHYHYHPPNIST